MRRATAPAKINLALVVGPLRADGKHEIATVLQRIALADQVGLAPADRLDVTGFQGDTIVTSALRALAAAVGELPNWSVELDKVVPVAAGLGGGSSDAATALRLANELLPAPLAPARLEEIAAGIGADVPFFLREGTQLGTGDGSTLEPLALPEDYIVVLVLPDDAVKTSTRDVYEAFDARSGSSGFATRRDALVATLAAARGRRDLASLPMNDLASSPVSALLLGAGAFRADVSGAGPCVYGLFDDRPLAEAAASELRRVGRTWVTEPVAS